jgi:hypothetical protein
MLALRLAPALLLMLALAGCSLSPVYLMERPLIARCLPPGVRMDDFVERGPLGMKVTVAEKLARLGAVPGWDGNLYDLSGKRIEFFRHYDGGSPPPPGMLEESWRHLEELKKTCTVIEICRDPDLPLPV